MCADHSNEFYAVKLNYVEYLKLMLTHNPELFADEVDYVKEILHSNNIEEIQYYVDLYDTISVQVGNTIFYAGLIEEYTENDISGNDYMICYEVSDGVDDTVIHDMQQAINGVTRAKPVYI